MGCQFLFQGIFPTRDQTRISYIGRQFLYHWATWEAHHPVYQSYFLCCTPHLALIPLMTYPCCCCCKVTSVVSDSVRPNRRQPTRLPRSWDFPGKSAGVGCHRLLQWHIPSPCLFQTPHSNFIVDIVRWMFLSQFRFGDQKPDSHLTTNLFLPPIALLSIHSSFWISLFPYTFS